MSKSSIRLGLGEAHTLVMSCYAHAKFTWAWCQIVWSRRSVTVTCRGIKRS